MEVFPEELELISLFCVDSKTTSADLPYYYRETMFNFFISELEYNVVIFPSVDEFSINVRDITKGIILFQGKYKTVSKLEIIKDNKNEASFRLFLDEDSDRFFMSIDITIKPYFSVNIEERFREL